MINKQKEETQNKYPLLSSFFHSYFSSPSSEVQTLDDIIEEYFNENTDEKKAKAIVSEIDRLLATSNNEEEIKKDMIDLGMFLNIDNDEWKTGTSSYKQLISNIKDRLIHNNSSAI